MITIEESIPTKNDAYKLGLDIFYVQFNEIFFYIEDEDQENFYFCILKKLFPDVVFEKIFPLGGKNAVIEESEKYLIDKKKVFIVDKDYDDILNRLVRNPNLFYLDRYSIENYLIEKESLIDYIIGEKPRLKRKRIDQLINLDELIIQIGETLHDLIILFIVVQIRCPHYKNVSLKHERFVGFNRVFLLKQDQFDQYKSEIESELQGLDRRLKINTQIKKIKKSISLNTIDAFLAHIPGKYIMKMVKFSIENSFRLPSRELDSFNYRIAEKCTFNSLKNIQDKIIAFLN
jgi:hypothetical protein